MYIMIHDRRGFGQIYQIDHAVVVAAVVVDCVVAVVVLSVDAAAKDNE